MWAVGINMSTSILLSLPESMGGYGMSMIALGNLYWAPIIAIVIGEALGHWGNDVRFSIFRSIEPESRLRVPSQAQGNSADRRSKIF